MFPVTNATQIVGVILFNKYALMNRFLQISMMEDRYGGKSMYQYKFSNEEDKKVLSALDEQNQPSKNIQDSFDNIDSKYTTQYTLPTTDNKLDLKRLGDVVVDQDAIKSQAENELRDERIASIDKINTTAKNKEAGLSSSIESARNNAIQQKANLDRLYEAKKTNASNEALKRGLARSSIIINQLEAFDQGKIDEYMKIDRELSRSIDSLNDQINTLNIEKDKALNEYNIAYATKLNNRIKELNDSLLSEQQKVIKYNNEIAEKEAEYTAKINKQNAELSSKNQADALSLATFIEKYGTETLNANKTTEKYNAALGILNGMDRASAMKELQSNADYYKDQLGNRYYTLLAVMNNRR